MLCVLLVAIALRAVQLQLETRPSDMTLAASPLCFTADGEATGEIEVELPQ